MSTVYLTIGIPASGKTTWARKTAAADKNTVIVSRDDIRAAHGWVSGFDENRVTRIHRAQIEAALLEDMDVIVADTNINKTFRNRLIKFCHQHGADVVLVPFEISLDEAILRDSTRQTHKVGPQVVKKFYDDLQGQELQDEFLPARTFEPVEFNYASQFPECIVVDIDGTVARHVNRSPYDYSKVGDDEPIWDVVNIINTLGQKYDIVFVSGRDDSCEDDTCAWLDEWITCRYTLIMRKTGDQRPDWEIKNEIYDAEVLPYWNVRMVFDDRDQVVRHLRKRGITVSQVAPGRF